MLVEAGAGSGKTSELLLRMLALIREGKATAADIAAVTFTRKAAAELRERFQAELEGAIAATGDSATGDSATGGSAAGSSVAGSSVAGGEHDGDHQPLNDQQRQRLEIALHDIDRGFIGTIHSFCARLLRERPIEAGLDPAFREIFGPEEKRMRREAWLRHLERLTNDGDSSLAELDRVNLEHFRLFDAYEKVVDNPDVSFHAAEVEQPQAGDLRRQLDVMLNHVEPLLPERRPEKGWDGFQNKIRALRRTRWNSGWDSDAVFFDALEAIVGRQLDMTLYKWDPNRATARKIRDRMMEFGTQGSEAERTLRRWQAHRYGIALRFAERAAAAYAGERRRAGLLSFNDLLMEAARLLRESRAARQDLAQRYRYLLVDEFQDTDPVQGEIVFLLTAADPEVSDWHVATPRPGALFVVGDPKQSIYRFRRADIGIYNQVKRRFGDFGEVVDLTTNFRSRPPIETFVNGVFDKLLPAEATASQAAFAPLNAHRDDAQPQGVFWYEVVSAGNTVDDIAAKDARLVASWIKRRIDDTERNAGDFMVLTYRKRCLGVYAAELERHEVPFQVTGAGVDIADELEELLHVLRALADPDNQLLTLAALVGLFFGIDHEQLVGHRLEHPLAGTLGNRVFDFTAREFADAGTSSTVVEQALARLHRWWRMTRRLPADVVIGSIVNELGLLPYLAAGESGGSNAGALEYTLNAVRQAGVSGDSSLGAALSALEEALEVEDAEAPLQPGREDVVRVMNLHKAKGLEAKVVILAHPTGDKMYEPSEHIERPETGDAHGGLLIEETKPGHHGKVRIAAPLNWEEMAAREAPFTVDERVRLLYVAATRAREELVISYCAKTEKKSPWRAFYEHREALCDRLELPDTEPPTPGRLDLSAASIVERVDELRARRRGHAVPSYEITSVTKMVKHDASIFAVDGGGMGRAWGNAVHEALEAANGGAGADGVRAICRTALLDNDLPVGTNGEPADLDDLVTLVDGVRRSATWQRAQEADSLLVEAPFALATNGGGDVGNIVEGVIDLAFEESDGWVIVDYKTDVIDDADNLEARRQQYRAQVDAYAMYFEAITGATVKERQILWVGGELKAEVW